MFSRGMMRVLLFCQRFLPSIGGVELHVAALAAGLRAAGHEALVVTSPGEDGLPDRIRLDGVEVVRFPFDAALAACDVERIAAGVALVARLKRSWRPDLVQVAFSDPIGFFHLKTVAAFPCPSLVAVHVSVETLGGSAPLFRALVGQAARTIAVSAAIGDELRAMMPGLGGLLLVQHHGVPAPSFVPEPPAMIGPRLLCLGRVVEEKGFDLALHALAQLRPALPQASLAIAGEGRARPALESLTRELGLLDSVRFLGRVEPEAVYDTLADCDILLVPSRYKEAFGQVAVQGAMMGRPVVASRVGGLPEIVADSTTGHLVPADDPAALALAVLGLCRDPDSARAMGRAARQRAVQAFDLTRTLCWYESLHATILAEQARHPMAG